MKKSIKDVFKINGHEIDFNAVGYSLKNLPAKVSSLVRGKTKDQIEKTICDSLSKKWDGINRSSKEFVCFKEQDGVLYPQHVEAGRSISFYPCVFILNCNLSMSVEKDIYLRIKIDKTGQTYQSSLYGGSYEYKVSEFFVCDEEGNSLLGFSQMPFPMDLKNLFLSLSKACGKDSLTKEDEGNVSKNVYASWIKHGMPPNDSAQPLIKDTVQDTAQHLTFETGLQTKDGRNVQVILWKEAQPDKEYQFGVIKGMSSLDESQRLNVGPNVGDAIVAARQVLNNELYQTKARNMHTDTVEKNAGGAKVQSVTEAVSGTWKAETEEAFLKRFIESVKQCGFNYAEQDLIRFHTCVKCGFLTVLGGAPGSGKSSIVKLYASAILGRRDKKCGDGMLMVDVNSSWAEPSDVLGYWDLERRYRSSTGVVPFLRAAIGSEHLNIVCLEEMNLARVEHYFSDFMQLSEREIAERELKGVPLEPECDDQEKACLPIDKSVRIVGTNNFDETTQRFSGRFFDRCNYIELQDSRKDDDFLFSRPNIDQGDFNHSVSWETYESWIKKDKDKGVVIKDENGKEIFGEGTVERFKKICGALKKLNLKPSPRVESSLIEYVVNRPFVGGFETDCKNQQLRALDEFVAQRILPRYTPSYLIDDSGYRKDLREKLVGMPLSLKILDEKNRELDGKPHA